MNSNTAVRAACRVGKRSRAVNSARKVLNHGISIGMALVAHAHRDAVGLQERPVVIGWVLAATIRGVDQFRCVSAMHRATVTSASSR